MRRDGQWPKLTVFLKHGEVPLDNNRLENAIRPLVIGRKGWLFSDTVPGARASANLYSLVETAKANNVEPHAYLSLLFAQLSYAKTVEDFERLLPWNVKAALPVTHLEYLDSVRERQKGRSHGLRRSDHAQLNRNPLERAGSAKDSAGRQLFGQGLEDSTLRKFSMMLLGPAGPGKTLAKYGPYSVAELPPNELVVPGINGPPRLHRHLCSSACVV